ncbi:peptide ABC transporter substrate-binding protein, partial [Burkholderia multivorans]
FYDTDETPSFLANHYRNEEINKELTDQASIADKGERAKAIEDIQNQLAEELPTLPLLQGNQIAVSGKDVKGVEDTLDPAFQFRLALLSK